MEMANPLCCNKIGFSRRHEYISKSLSPVSLPPSYMVESLAAAASFQV